MRSFDAVKMVLDKAPKDLTPIQRLVLIQIAHKQPKCYATVGTLADDCGIRQKKTVSKAVKVLESKGLIAVNRRRYSSNEYVLLGRLMVGREIPAQLGRLTPSPDPHATPVKQTLNKQENKKAFFQFLSNFPDSNIREDVVYKAWSRALLKDASEDLLVTASRANREMLEPDAWLNFEKWKSFKPGIDDDDDSWKERAIND